MTDYGKIMADAATSGFDTGYNAEQQKKRDKSQQEHEKFMQLEKILASSQESLNRYEQQKALNLQQHELKQQESDIVSRKQGFIETGIGGILGNRTMSSSDKTQLLKGKFYELQKLGLADNIDVTNLRVDDQNPDLLIYNDVNSGKELKVDASSLFETKQGQESYYRSKFTPEGVNPYASVSKDDGKLESEKYLSDAIAEAESILLKYSDDSTRHPITRALGEKIPLRLSAEQEALKTVGSQIKGLLFKKFGYRNEAEFKNLPDLSPDKSVEANLAILEELKALSGGSGDNRFVHVKCPDGKVRNLPLSKLENEPWYNAK